MSAFAQLSPSELLRETERAAGGDQLLKDHDDLIAFRKNEKKFVGECDQWTSKVQNLEARNQAVEREVTRYLERDAILNKIRILELSVPWIKYDHLVAMYQDSKEAKNEAKTVYEELMANEAPLHEEIKKSKTDSQKYDQLARNSQKEFNELTNVSF